MDTVIRTGRTGERLSIIFESEEEMKNVVAILHAAMEHLADNIVDETAAENNRAFYNEIPKIIENNYREYNAELSSCLFGNHIKYLFWTLYDFAEFVNKSSEYIQVLEQNVAMQRDTIKLLEQIVEIKDEMIEHSDVTIAFLQKVIESKEMENGPSE